MAILDIPKLFRDSARALTDARERCIQVHHTDIRAAGNEVEIAVRDFFQRMLPRRFHVTHGHLIDQNGTVSPQIDLIISDNTGLPSLLTASDGTKYIPVESVFAIAEIKSTYYRSHRPISGFSKILKMIREDMARPLVLNTAHEGLQPTTVMRHAMLRCPNKYLNPLFSFMVFVNDGDMTDEILDSELQENLDADLPGMMIALNRGVIFYCRQNDQGLPFEKYPSHVAPEEHSWRISPLYGGSESGSLEGNHLGMLYYALLSHLNQSFLDPPDVSPYFSSMLIGRKSTTREVKRPQQARHDSHYQPPCCEDPQ